MKTAHKPRSQDRADYGEGSFPDATVPPYPRHIRILAWSMAILLPWMIIGLICVSLLALLL